MFKVTQLDSGAGIQIQAVLLQFRNKIDKFYFLLFFNRQIFYLSGT